MTSEEWNHESVHPARNSRRRQGRRLTEHRSSVGRLSPPVSVLSSDALQHAVTLQLSCCCAVQQRRQGFVAAKTVSRRAGESCVSTNHGAAPLPRHSSVCLWDLTWFVSCPLPQPRFHGGVSKPHCQHVMSLHEVGMK